MPLTSLLMFFCSLAIGIQCCRWCTFQLMCIEPGTMPLYCYCKSPPPLPIIIMLLSTLRQTTSLREMLVQWPAAFASCFCRLTKAQQQEYTLEPGQQHSSAHLAWHTCWWPATWCYSSCFGSASQLSLTTQPQRHHLWA